MKHFLLLIILFFINLLAFAQVRYRIKLVGTKSIETEAVYIIFPSLKKVVAYDSVTAVNLTIDNPTATRLAVYAETAHLRTPVVVVSTLPKIINHITLDFGIQKNQPKFCPMCKKTDQVIDVVYGFPSQVMAAKVTNREVWLSTQALKNNNPKYYCKRDKLEF